MNAAWCGVEWGGASSTSPPVTAPAARDRVRRPESVRRARLALGPSDHAAPAFDEERLYRGCVAYGDFEIRSRFLIGRAVDEAAAHYERAEAAIVWFTPDAQHLFVQTSGGATIGGLPLFDVPLKGGGTFRTTAISPFALDEGEEGARSLANTMLRTFDPVHPAQRQLDVEVKRQNTVRFLDECMLARGWGRSPTS